MSGTQDTLYGLCEHGFKRGTIPGTHLTECTRQNCEAWRSHKGRHYSPCKSESQTEATDGETKALAEFLEAWFDANCIHTSDELAEAIVAFLAEREAEAAYGLR